MKRIYMQGKNADKYVLVDEIDYPILKTFKWYLKGGGYAGAFVYLGTVVKKRIVFRMAMHQMIMVLAGTPASKDQETDHEDCDKMNCQRYNLRNCSKTQNRWNKPLNRNNTSGYKGVTWQQHARRWRAQITFNHREFNLGYFDTPEEAARAFNAAAIKYRGDFANLNVIPEASD